MVKKFTESYFDFLPFANQFLYGVSIGVSVRIAEANSVDDFCQPVGSSIENTSENCVFLKAFRRRQSSKG